MINFTLSPSQQSQRQASAGFAQSILAEARKTYETLPNDGRSRFQSTKPVLETAAKLGLIKSLIPPPLDGTGGTLVDSAITVEELFAVEPSISLTFLGNGLGLTPIFVGDFAGREDLRQEILHPFLSGDGAPTASLVFSEPEGSANFMQKDGKGIQTTAVLQEDDWIINGEKIWATNCAGFDFLGADVQCIVARNPQISDSREDSMMLILLTRETLEDNRKQDPNCYTILRHPLMPGFSASSGPHIKMTNIRIPSRYVLASGHEAVRIVAASFTCSAVIVGAMSIGIMRAAFESALNFARTRDQGGGAASILEYQSPADLLIDMKMRIEACRALTWKAASAIDHQLPGAAELAYEAKIYCSQAAVKCVAEGMRVVGIASYDAEEYPFARLMADALVLPIFDGGNQGIRRRQLQSIFLQPDYDPWAATFPSQSIENGANGH